MNIKKLLIVALVLPVVTLSAQQVDWKRFERMLWNGEYKDVYTQAESIYRGSGNSSDRLGAAYWMGQAAEHYQEDAYDSSLARYRALLPELDSLDRALCYAFIGCYDSALMYEQVLKRTQVTSMERYFEGGKTLIVTPTVYDVIVRMMMQRSHGMKAREMAAWQRRLCEFHAVDNDDIRIWHDLQLLDIPGFGRIPDTVQRYINKYRGTKSDGITSLYFLMANSLNADGEYVRALAYCDSAIRMFPKSRGSVDCINLRNDITHVKAALTGSITASPDRQTLMLATYRNTKHLWFRLIPYIEDFYWDDSERRLSRAKPLREWNIEVPGNDEYRHEACYVALPAIATGHYIVIVSPDEDFKKHGFMAYEVNCTDMQLVQCGQEGLLLDRRTGRPIAGQEVKVMKSKYRFDNGHYYDTTLVASTHTDRDGRYRFDIAAQWNYFLVIDRDGFRLTMSFDSGGKPDTAWKQQVEVRMDRPIYKPGDTAHAAVVYFVTDGLEAAAAQFFQVECSLLDPNGKEVKTDTVKTDRYGIASLQFVLPKDRLPGTYSLVVKNYGTTRRVVNLRVEEYKQPKFTVVMPMAEPVAAPSFGEPYTVRGMAASYSAVPVSGAKVKYTVSRSRMHRWYSMGAFSQVAEGETTTGADGSFAITFTPEPDSNEDLSARPGFEYTVSVDVTDLNGESHPASTRVRVGYCNAFIALDGEEEVRTLDGLKPRLFDLNGNALPGEVAMRVELLRQPEVPLFSMVDSGVRHSMGEAEFSKAFPLYAYSADYNNRDKWPVADTGWRGRSGVYRITLTAEGADTVVAYRVVTAADARKVQSQALLWYDIDKHQAEVGDTVTLRLGSRFRDVEVYYQRRSGYGEADFRRLKISDQLKSIKIVVDSAMLGGFGIDLVAVREGVVANHHLRVDVPFTHKKLDVEIATFRDRLQPGETEEWTIKVNGERLMVNEADAPNNRVSPLTTNHSPLTIATLIMTMYDDALNSYGGARSWGFSPWRVNSSPTMWFYEYGGGSAWCRKQPDHEYYYGKNPSVWYLREALSRRRYYGTARGESGMVTMQGNVRKRTGVNMKVVDNEEVAAIEIGSPESGMRLSADDIQRMPGNTVESIVAAVGGIGYTDEAVAMPKAAMIQTEESEIDSEDLSAAEMRTNLNTLAFFVAGLRTDSTGTATYRFTVPELLTRWNVRGLAITSDMKIGTLDKSLITSKRLMVQPNMPRFLRSGDSLSLMAKVIVNEELRIKNEELPVSVSFLLTDATTGDTICRQRTSVKVKDAAQVMFDVEVPHNVYVATYQIVAHAEGMSDGERGQLPVVSNRQAVTVSQALYINGPGEKTFQFPLSTYNSPTAEPRLVAAELTSNPIWLAIKSMPYLKTQENPSTLYLANQLYVNSLGQNLVELVQLEKLERLEYQQSRLSINEDVKQTLLQATPWLRDAESEEEQMAAVRNYFDTAALNTELRTLTKELIQRQNADGGWSWMPEGKSSVWATQQVLKALVPCVAMLSQQTQSALEYIDKEQQRDYEKYYKPSVARGSTSYKPVNIDYLYTRSFYGKAKTEAYKFYYANALKSYKEYENLYIQAQLALIFYRHGDHKEALDLLRRLKQKALESDEMGMYWRDNKSGWWWYQRPIETQALIIQAFAEITPSDTVSIGKMQQWLLKQKQTSHWGNDQATTKAIAALLAGRTSPTRETSPTSSTRKTSNTSLTIFGTPLTGEATGAEGYQSQRWTGGALDTLLAEGNDKLVLRKSDRGIAWGAVYYQFTDDMDKIPASAMGITVNRSYSILDFTGDQKSAKVGDRMLVSIEITCDRAMDYLELIDGRPSCVEPLSTRAGWRWTDGLSYYITVNNTDTRCYIEHIDKGKYVFEYEVYVTNPGTFMAGPVTMQCMYAPEFRAVAPGTRIVVEE